MRRQKPVKGGRPRLSSSVAARVNAVVIETSRRFGVSKSFVQNVAMAKAFGIPLEDTFDIVKHRRKR